MPKSAAVEQLVEELADLFFREVVAADTAWTDALAAASDDPEQSQQVFYAGSPNEEEDIFERYNRWVEESPRIPQKDQRVARSLADQVLFDVSKRVGTFEKVKPELSASISEADLIAVEVLASEYGAHKVRTYEGRTTFYFDTVADVQKFARDLSEVEDVVTSSRVQFSSPR